MSVQIFAHRGYSSRAMENSMTAFQMAKQANVDGIELDVHLTRDGEIVVIHDESLDRTTTGTGWIGQLSYSQISNYSLLSLENEIVPTLSNVFELFLDKKTRINIELKNQLVPYKGIVEKVIQLIEHYGMEQRVILSSFHHPSLMELKKLRPTWEIAPLIDCVMVKPWKYAKFLGMNQVHLHYSAIDEDVVVQCNQNNIKIRTYTVNQVKDMQRLVELGIDAIITNYPTRLRRVIDHLGDGVIE
ncbi:glycerophosphodiester phosphodiesterase [Shimazuella kribbensis]|uniref:glycerophosphodiester phosphodiesterase n=1 Tax=Shimazuella kribbensis TaxID=139808 RepID=UPI00041FD489|nr:glycerophosphodiester phosphodiesterase [Shimazuella kribbensis]